MRDKVNSAIQEMKSAFYERDRIVEAAWYAILSRQHMLLLGVPGTAKSMLIDTLCRQIEGTQYFQWLLTRFSTPEELFGPVSLKGMENDEYRRIVDGKLPEAHIAFVDEIFKGNAAILNSLLTAINERAFDNGNTRLKIPLISMFGASNELPEEDELDALYDRFILRFDVKYIQETNNWCNLIAGNNSSVDANIINLDEIRVAQAEVDAIKMPMDVVQVMRDIKMELEYEGIVASDRRWKQTVSVLKAKAYVDGRDEVEEQDLDLLCDMLWKEPEQRKTLVTKVLSVTNPLDLKATKLYDDCLDVFSRFSPDVDESTKIEVSSKLKAALDEINNTLKIADKAKTRRMTEVQGSIKQWYRATIESLEI